jgi:hypothetical protein
MFNKIRVSTGLFISLISLLLSQPTVAGIKDFRAEEGQLQTVSDKSGRILCADAKNVWSINDVRNNNPAQVYFCDEGQKTNTMKINPVRQESNGVYHGEKLKLGDSNMCLDVDAKLYTPLKEGTRVVFYDCRFATNWIIGGGIQNQNGTKSFSGEIVPVSFSNTTYYEQVGKSRFCLDVEGAANGIGVKGMPLKIYKSWGGKNQKFTFRVNYQPHFQGSPNTLPVYW